MQGRVNGRISRDEDPSDMDNKKQETSTHTQRHGRTRRGKTCVEAAAGVEGREGKRRRTGSWNREYNHFARLVQQPVLPFRHTHTPTHGRDHYTQSLCPDVRYEHLPALRLLVLRTHTSCAQKMPPRNSPHCNLRHSTTFIFHLTGSGMAATHFLI